MATTNFETGTVVTKEWLNDLDAFFYELFAASTTAGGARTALGLGTIATQSAAAVAITGGTISGITDLAVADGGTGASTAGAARTNLDAMEDVFTTIGDSVEATTAGAAARRAATATVAADATTMNPWIAREVTLSGSAVTFTDIADAPFAGAVVWIKQNAAHIWTDGAVFVVQGDANYTAADGDWIRVYATTVSTFEITIFKATGAATAIASQADQEAGTSVSGAVTPARQQFHPSAAKAWCMATNGGVVSAGYNMTSVTDVGVGLITFTWATDFSSGTYCAVGSIKVDIGGTAASTYIMAIDNTSFLAGSVNATAARVSDGVLIDPNHWMIVAFGDQ